MTFDSVVEYSAAWTRPEFHSVEMECLPTAVAREVWGHAPQNHYRQSITGSRDTLTIPGQNYSSPLPPVRVSRDTLTILGQRSWSATKTQWSINFLCWSKCEKHGDHSYWIVSCPDAMHVHMRGSGYTSPNPLACFRM